MNKFKKLLFVLTIVSFGFGSVCSQDVHFSQFYTNPVFYNPAAAGSQFGNMRANMMYRDQWKVLSDNPYTTISAGGDMGFYGRKSRGMKPYIGVGVNFYNDVSGDSKLSTTMGNVAISCIVPISRLHRISAGISGGFGQRFIDYSGLTWDNQYSPDLYGANPMIDPREYTLKTRVFYPDLSAGVFYSYGRENSAMRSNDERRFSVGFAMHHLNRPRISLSGVEDERLYMKYNFYFTGGFGVSSSNMTIKPAMIMNFQGKQQEIIAGAMINYRLKGPSRHTGFIKESSIGFGAYYRVLDAFILAMRAELSRIAIGISYDATSSSLQQTPFGRGGFEVSLSFGMPNPNGIRSRYSRTYF